MESNETVAHAGRGRADAPSLEVLQGWLVLLPLAVLCLPGQLLSTGSGALSPFEGAPDTTSIGVGIVALSAIPAALLATLRGRGGRLLGLPLFYIVLAFAAYHLPRAADTFGAWRSVTGLAAAAGWAIAGTALGPGGRMVVARGLPVISLLLLAGALTTDGGAALGNSGDFSEAALPGAILGAGLFLRGERLLSVLGLAVLGLFAMKVGAIPVYAGLLGLGAAALAAAIGMPLAGGDSDRRASCARRLRLLLVALLIGLTPLGYRLATSGAEEAAPAEVLVAGRRDTAGADTTTGGFAFRLKTWARVPTLLGVHAPLGAGPGQFQAAFPPFRDPAEIEASSFDRREPTPIEVEHAHNDPLTAVAELGYVGGGAFVLLLLLALVRSVKLIASGEDDQRDLALATVAVLANCTVNSPLLYGPVAPLIGFCLIGSVLGRDGSAPSGEAGAERPRVLSDQWYDRLAPGLALVALLLLTPRAVSLIRYGRAMAEVPDARIVLEDGREKLDAQRLRGILDRAGEHAPESPIVLETRRALLASEGAPAEEQRAALDAWLMRRPHSFAALMNRGVLEARVGEYEAAERAFYRALLLDPGSPSLLQNLVRLGCDRRQPADVEEALQMLASIGRLDPAFVRRLALEKTLEGRLGVAAPLVKSWRTAEGLDPIDLDDANATYRAQKDAAARDEARERDAFTVATKVLFGVQDLSGGNAQQAATQFRLAYQKSRDAGVDTTTLRLLLAASFAAAGDLPVATGWMETGPFPPMEFSLLPEDARQALRDSGLADGPRPRLERTPAASESR
jgi:O-antigen ligase/tetratricopeptide (TPR) repeat protein